MKLALAGAGHGRASYLLRSRGYLLPLVLLAVVIGFGATTQKRPAGVQQPAGRSEVASRVRCSMAGRFAVRIAMTAFLAATPLSAPADASDQNAGARCAVRTGAAPGEPPQGF